MQKNFDVNIVRIPLYIEYRQLAELHINVEESWARGYSMDNGRNFNELEVAELLKEFAPEYLHHIEGVRVE